MEVAVAVVGRSRSRSRSHDRGGLVAIGWSQWPRQYSSSGGSNGSRHAVRDGALIGWSSLPFILRTDVKIDREVRRLEVGVLGLIVEEARAEAVVGHVREWC